MNDTLIGSRNERMYKTKKRYNQEKVKQKKTESVRKRTSKFQNSSYKKISLK